MLAHGHFYLYRHECFWETWATKTFRATWLLDFRPIDTQFFAELLFRPLYRRMWEQTEYWTGLQAPGVVEHFWSRHGNLHFEPLRPPVPFPCRGLTRVMWSKEGVLSSWQIHLIQRRVQDWTLPQMQLARPWKTNRAKGLLETLDYFLFFSKYSFVVVKAYPWQT